MSGWRGQRKGMDGTARRAFDAIVDVLGTAPGLVLTRALRRMARRRPDVFERLGRYQNTLFALDAVDVPLRFLLWPRGEHGAVRVFARGAGGYADATVSGRLDALLAMALGRRDADSEMFARDLTISGDTAALVALRNTLDASDLDWIDLLGVPRPAIKPLEGAVAFAMQAARAAGLH